MRWFLILMVCFSCSSDPYCGDGQITGEEECDGENLREFTCEYFGFTGGTLRCNECRVDVTQCVYERSENDLEI